MPNGLFTFNEYLLDFASDKTINKGNKLINKIISNVQKEGLKNKMKNVIEDINKLRQMDIQKKAVLFIVFPVEHENEHWQVQLQRIKQELTSLRMFPFTFKGEVVKAVVYLGLV